ncbi:NAD(P)-dependent oxidoreductase [Enterococcus casseliflavus]|uniref:NAD-dependent epimerase/dehydratase family protein n=1 Tax=Enterococcus casseliflavus TaxID=37734 RepID=UPI001432FD80|nr:NAD(P)-dependent oxidoreductase [Enterococcus casseliflavus]NKD28205.1 NAD(P)-dependent oxidoreductase [Enterococcus casseliflavus]
MKKIFVLGGTGFLGYYTIKELLRRGYQVKTMALPPMPTEDLLPKEVTCTLGNINEMSDAQIIDLLGDCEGFIYAAGADERTTPAKPAMKFFYEANVLPTQRLARLAKQAGVSKFVVFGSYFAEFAERLPEFHLRQQAYPAMRLLQEQVAFAEGEGAMTVTSLRLPYIFGTMPGRDPLWKVFVDQARNQPVFPALAGGTAMVTVEQVAEAAVGAMETGKHRHTYAICAKNMKFQAFYQLIVDALGQTDTTQVPVVPYDQMKPIYEGLDQQAEAEGLEHGIHMVISSKLQTVDLYLDPAETMPVLGIKEHDVVASIKQTLAKCVSPQQH